MYRSHRSGVEGLVRENAVVFSTRTIDWCVRVSAIWSNYLTDPKDHEQNGIW